jgi:RNA polymerase sigma-70 factor (ECF subfamily)
MFLAQLGAAGPRPEPASADCARLTEAITRLHRRGAEAWAPVTLELETYAIHLARCLAAAPGSADPVVSIEALYTSDLYLACAAGHGAPGARELFARTVLQPIAGAVQTIDGGPAIVDEVRQVLHERLLLSAEGPPRILQYGGRSALATWVGVAAQRAALDLLRTEGARRRAAERAAHEPLPLELDPELQYLKARYSGAFKEALGAAVRRLPQRQRIAIRLHTVGGLTLAKIAAMFSVEESTACRWVQRAREVILAETQRELGERLGICVAEVPSLARLVTSQLDLSIARLFGDETNS